jgi:chromatin remodeling complex protein RSC6
MIELRKKSACVSEDSARERTEDAPVDEESKEGEEEEEQTEESQEEEEEQAEESKEGELEEENKKKGDKKHKGKKEKHYLLLDEKHIFRNQNGWMATLDEKNAKILKSLDVGVLAIGLKSVCAHLFELV